MIINYPTGLYKNVLTTSVTYTVSVPPPRSKMVYSKIPIGVQKKKQATKQSVKLNNYGRLAFSTVVSGRSNVGSNSRQYEIGQVLEFTDLITKLIEPMLVSKNTSIQHDTNVLDYTSMGLNDEDVNRINSSSSSEYEILAQSLAQYVSDRCNAEINIAEYQKKINEINRAIVALNLVSGVNDIIAKLTATMDEYTILLNVAIATAETSATLAQQTKDALVSLSIIVK